MMHSWGRFKKLGIHPAVLEELGAHISNREEAEVCEHLVYMGL